MTKAMPAEHEPALVRAARMKKTDGAPVWFMRQAGRVLPEYRKVREGYSLLDICRDPELAATVTLQPVARFDVDAAIIFADIVTPLVGVGVDVKIVEKVGPVIDSPISSVDDLERLRPAGTRPGHSVHDGDAQAGQGRTAARKGAHRLRGRSLHPRHLPDRGRPFQELRRDEGRHVRPSPTSGMA